MRWDEVLSTVNGAKFESCYDYSIKMSPYAESPVWYHTNLNLSDILRHCLCKTSTIEDSIKDVIFNDPATIIIWKDGTKTVVKAQDEPFDKEKGFAIAIIKHLCGDKGNYNNLFRKFVDNNDEIRKATKKSVKKNVRLQETK